jgi:hypothetical protein
MKLRSTPHSGRGSQYSVIRIVARLFETGIHYSAGINGFHMTMYLLSQLLLWT